MKKVTAAVMFMLMAAVWLPMRAFAGGSIEPMELPPGLSAESVYVCELGSMVGIAGQAQDKVLPAGHMAKLMTVLLFAEEMQAGRLSLDEQVTAGAAAEGLPAPVIWLEKGDSISAEELLKAVTMGNANDACAVLGERLSGSAEKHIARMNERAAELGMEHTRFADCIGLDKQTVTTARDLSRLTAELVKYESLTPYFTQWMDTVRDGKAELVNTNRLVRSCKGLLAGKLCAGRAGGTSLITAVKRGEMTIFTAVLENTDRDKALACTEQMLESVFENYRLFKPEADSEYLKSIPVTRGCERSAKVYAEKSGGVLLPRGVSSRIETEADIPESLAAPVEKGAAVGCLIYTLDGEELLKIDICAEKEVRKADWRFGIYRSLCNLFNIKG